MGRVYTATFNGVSIAAVSDLFFLEAPAIGVISIHEFKLTQVTSTTSETLSVLGFRTATDQGAKGTALTASPHDESAVAAEQTVQSAILAADTLATLGVVLYSEVQNVLNGFHYLPAPEDRIVISAAKYFVFKLNTVPSGALLFNGSVTYEEIGG